MHKPTNNRDIYGLDYVSLVTPLVRAVQELNKANTELEKNENELRSELAELKLLISRLIIGQSNKAFLTNGALL